MNASSRRTRGFTLIELVVVITISAILAVFMVFFLSTPVEAYFAQSQRAAFVDSADHILRSVGSDVPTALPNSIREASSGSVVALELLATTAVARYYGQGDKSYLPPAQQKLEELWLNQLDTDFYTLDLFASTSGSYLAIDNQTLPGAYAFGGVMTPLPRTFTITAVGATSEDHVNFTAPGFDFTTASPTNSVFLVSGPVSYLCDTTAQTLERYSGYTVSAVQYTTAAGLTAAGATASLIAQNVSACTFTVVPAPASAAYGQLVDLQVTLASGGESLVVFDEAATSYVP
jgi:MSHA biogenesis protein MshO